MMAVKSLVWEGKAVTERMRKAMIDGVNKTMGDCVVYAKINHTWQNQSTDLERSIRVTSYAALKGTYVVGQWGSVGLNYALIHELGGVIVPKKAKALAIPQADGSVRLVKKVTIPARPYLRPAADAIYPQLAANIRRAFEKGGAPGAGATDG
jgi:phage gpG-like protein